MSGELVRPAEEQMRVLEAGQPVLAYKASLSEGKTRVAWWEMRPIESPALPRRVVVMTLLLPSAWQAEWFSFGLTSLWPEPVNSEAATPEILSAIAAHRVGRAAADWCKFRSTFRHTGITLLMSTTAAGAVDEAALVETLGRSGLRWLSATSHAARGVLLHDVDPTSIPNPLPAWLTQPEAAHGG